jgi:hypothetical protein
LFNNASANQTIPLNHQDNIELISIFKSLWYEYQKKEYINQLDALAAYLKIIMIKIANVSEFSSQEFLRLYFAFSLERIINPFIVKMRI